MFYSSSIIPEPPKNMIDFYVISSSSNDIIYFNKNQLLLMYYLIYFSYFDREIINNIYDSLSYSSKLQLGWLQSCIGGRNHPISEYKDYKDGRKKIYYLNKSFVRWLLETLPNHNSIISPIAKYQLEYPQYSIKKNRLHGGKPRTVNLHDLEVRRQCSKIVKHLSLYTKNNTSIILDVQLFFPKDKKRKSLLPDGIVFINNHPYYIEYDRYTENHHRLLAKIIGYYELKEYNSSNLVFIFDQLPHPKNSFLHPRISTFLKNVEETINQKKGKTYWSLLKENEVYLSAVPSQDGYQHIAYMIARECGVIELNKDYLTLEKLSGIGGIPLDVTEVIIEESKSIFSFMIKAENDFFETILVPVIDYNYIECGYLTNLENLYQRYKDEYEHIAVNFGRPYPSQFIKLIHQNFFYPIYI